MKFLNFSFLRARENQKIVWMLFKRFKSRKEKYNAKSLENNNAELALRHYDIHLGSIYKEQWPSMRLALLSQPKYCAVMNNFCADHDNFLYKLAENGGFDFVSRFKSIESHEGKFSLIQPEKDETLLEKEFENSKNEFDQSSTNRQNEEILHTDSPLKSSQTDLFTFVPGERVLSVRESLLRKENLLNHPQSFIQDDDNESTIKDVSVHSSESFQYPQKLKAIIHTSGDLTVFSPAKRDFSTGKLSYYLMDAGSVLPVLALDLFPDCHVLDMCAAPGGKSFCMLQTMLPGLLVCVDKSFSRISRLRNTLKSFFFSSYTQNFDNGSDNRVEVKHVDACTYAHTHAEQFDRVLVDVPCYSDRHTLADVDNEDNTLFKSSRQQDRIYLQNMQQQLLVGGLRAVRPGGIVIYSTCTLFPSQNDLVVKLAIENASEQLSVEAEVLDTGPLAEAYEDYFNFQKPWKGKLGQLVLPNMVSNFGPTYFCKIRRTK